MKTPCPDQKKTESAGEKDGADALRLAEYYMGLALQEAKKTAASGSGDLPVGCVILGKDGSVLASCGNTREETGSVLGHAEIAALEEARKKNGDYRLPDAVLFVTLEPCPMCAGAIAAARIGTVFYGASNKTNGACGTVYNLLFPQVRVFGGIRAEEASALLTDFFASRRKEGAGGRFPADCF